MGDSIDLGSVADWIQAGAAVITMVAAWFFMVDRRDAQGSRIRISPLHGRTYAVKFAKGDESEHLRARIVVLSPRSVLVRGIDATKYEPASGGLVVSKEAPAAARSIELQLRTPHGAPPDELSAQFRLVGSGSGSKLKVTVCTWPSKSLRITRKIDVTIAS